MSETDWDTCDQHEFTFPRHTECPYCHIEELEAVIDRVKALDERLIERLRGIARSDTMTTEFTPSEHIAWIAAERIAALQARLDAVKSVGFKHGSDDWSDGWDDAIKTVR